MGVALYLQRSSFKMKGHLAFLPISSWNLWYHPDQCTHTHTHTHISIYTSNIPFPFRFLFNLSTPHIKTISIKKNANVFKKISHSLCKPVRHQAPSCALTYSICCCKLPPWFGPGNKPVVFHAYDRLLVQLSLVYGHAWLASCSVPSPCRGCFGRMQLPWWRREERRRKGDFQWPCKSA